MKRSVWQPYLIGFLAFVVSQFSVAAEPPARPPMPVQTVTAEQTQLPYVKSYPAMLHPIHQIEVHSRVSGVIKAQQYQEGDTVSKGQTLYLIDDRRYQAQLQQAKANQASLETQIQQAKRNYQRQQSLLAKGQAVSKQSVDDALSLLETLQAQLKAADANVLAAQIELDDTHIKAEISGIIGQRQQDVGDLVNVLTGNTRLNTIQNIDQLYAVFALADRDREQLQQLVKEDVLKLNDSPTVTLLQNNAATQTTGKINFADSQIDVATASQLVRAQFDNPTHTLLPGQAVRVSVEHGQWQHVYAVPEVAIMQMATQAFVYVVENNLAVMRPVELVGRYQNQWLVRNGLNAGDHIITGNLIKLRPNTPVQILPAQPTPEATGGQ